MDNSKAVVCPRCGDGPLIHSSDNLNWQVFHHCEKVPDLTIEFRQPFPDETKAIQAWNFYMIEMTLPTKTVKILLGPSEA